MTTVGPGFATTFQTTDDGYLLNQDFIFAVQKGQVSGYSVVAKFGRNADVDTAANEDIWDGGGVWVAPTQDRLHNIASTDANDAAAGTGARTVEVFGLTAGVITSETVTLNGVSNVATTNAYGIIYRMIVRTAGSGGVNAGTITATAQTDATVTAQINVGLNQTLMAIYQIPTGKTGYIYRWYGDMNRNVTTGAADLRLLIKPDGEVFQTKRFNGLLNAGSSGFDKMLSSLKVEASGIVKIDAGVSANDTDISAGFDILLADN